jgi:hypothetical protein
MTDERPSMFQSAGEAVGCFAAIVIVAGPIFVLGWWVLFG